MLETPPPYRASIRDRALVAGQLWDWGWLQAAFAPTMARPSDLDGIIEQDGHLLVLEGKPDAYTWQEHNAQFRTLKTLSGKPGTSVLIVYGDPAAAPPQVHAAEVVIPLGPKHLPAEPATNDDVIRRVRRWFQHTHHCCHAAVCLYSL